MDPQRWQEVRALFDQLAELRPDQRMERLVRMGARDPHLRHSVASLLAADDQADEWLGKLDAVLLPPPPETSFRAPPADPLGLTGRTLAHFRILEPLGVGGMGVVYRAQDTRLNRTVALKVPLSEYRSDTSAEQRFLHEARSAAALDHPNLCGIYEVGESVEGHPFLAMPLLPGETLKQRLAREGSLPIGEAVEIARQVAAGLAAAHQSGIVHRDIKPGNVMLLADGAVKVLDFGLAKVRDLTLTGSRAQLGTVAYMAPEQIRREPIDGRTDLWSLGVVLYEMLTGQRPCGGEHHAAVAHAIVYEEPVRPAVLRDGIPPSLEGLLRTLLRKERVNRPRSAQQVAADLAAIQQGRAPPLRQRWAALGWQRRRAPRAAMGVLPVAMLAIAVMTGLRGWAVSGVPEAGNSRSAATPLLPPALEHASIAVLPFIDLSPERDQEYFSDGITEEILNALARVPELRVPARTSSFFFKGTSLPVREVAQHLDVAAVLEGSVRRVENHVRITARLIDARSDRQLWSHTFDRELEDVFGVQTEIARTVADALKVRLAVGQSLANGRSPVNPVAHDLYLRGHFHWNRRSTNDLEHAIRFFEEATRADPGYARAHAGLALAYAVLPISFGNSLPAADAFAKAEAAASRALALDPSLGDAHAARGYAYRWQWRWMDAERELARAVALNPENAIARQWYGEHLANLGRGREGEEQMRRALALDPFSLVAHSNLGIVLMNNRRLPESIAQFEHTQRLDPGFAIPPYLLQRLYLLTGRTEDAARAGRRWAELSGMADPEEVLTLIRATRSKVERPTALAILARWERAREPRWLDIAFYYTALDERERAIAALEHGLRLHTPMMVQLIKAPWFDPLRDDPRVVSILREMGVSSNGDPR